MEEVNSRRECHQYRKKQGMCREERGGREKGGGQGRKREREGRKRRKGEGEETVNFHLRIHLELCV